MTDLTELLAAVDSLRAVRTVSLDQSLVCPERERKWNW